MIHGSLYRVLIYGGPCKIGLMVCLDRSDWMFGWLGSWGAPRAFPATPVSTIILPDQNNKQPGTPNDSKHKRNNERKVILNLFCIYLVFLFKREIFTFKKERIYLFHTKKSPKTI